MPLLRRHDGYYEPNFFERLLCKGLITAYFDVKAANHPLRQGLWIAKNCIHKLRNKNKDLKGEIKELKMIIDTQDKSIANLTNELMLYREVHEPVINKNTVLKTHKDFI